MEPSPAALVAVAVLLAAAGCSSPPPAARPSPSPSVSTTLPAPAPSGDRGLDWWRANRDQPWAAHVKSVDAVGRLLIVGTDLAATETDTAVLVCRAGHAYVASIGAFDASVIVDGATEGARRVRLAESQDGRPCQVAL